MSSHREAPEISKDPVADSTDLYAFVSPDARDTVTLIANYVPLQGPAGGPNFYEFGDDVLYEIHIDNDADARVDITFEFRFRTVIEVGGTFLYNVGPITSLDARTWNRRQFYTVTRIDWDRTHSHDRHRSHDHDHHDHHDDDDHDDRSNGKRTLLATDVPCPPCNVGPRSTPNYAGLANAAIRSLPGGGKVFAGQRAEGFYVDLGSIFDLGALRPIQSLHLLPVPGSALGVNATKDLNVHTIALQIPKTHLSRDNVNPTDVASPFSVLGVWTTASRQRVRFRHASSQGNPANAGPWTQVSRLGNPLFNEVLVPMERKDDWNADPPSNDREYADGVLHPELAKLLPVLYPTAFPNLKKLVASGKPRADLAAILLTGIPSGLLPFQNFTGSTQADLLRLNMAIPPSPAPKNLGVIGGDVAGFPNGRRLADDVVTIELRAIAGAAYPLIDSTYKPDAAVGAVTQGLTASDTDRSAKGTEQYLSAFPYLGHPHSGYDVPAA
jgi:hypothetical protein